MPSVQHAGRVRPGWLDRERTVAPPGYNRWFVLPAALAVHLCIGEVYAFSVFKNPLVKHFHSDLTAIGAIFSIAIVMLGLSAACCGRWVERNGPRKAMVVSMLFWVAGFLVAAAGITVNRLWLVYLGYGVIGGIGLGIGYISPVSTLVAWFPDKPGLATGMAIMGFGGGALIASPMSNSLLERYAHEASGGLAGSFVTLAVLYAVVMSLGARVIKVPPEGWAPEGFVPHRTINGMRNTLNVSAHSAIRTPQFWLLWVVLFCNVTAGIGILEQASPMIQDFFSAVNPTEAAGFVGLLSLCNMAGRFMWSSTSDIIGRRPIYAIYLGVSALLYVVLAVAGSSAKVIFVVTAGIILTFYGGGFATVPAYLEDLFGRREIGAIHGRLLTAWSAAGVVGPLIVDRIADDQRSAGFTGASLYTRSFVIMVLVLIVGFIANSLVRPVGAWHEDLPLEPRTPTAYDGVRPRNGDFRARPPVSPYVPPGTPPRAGEQTWRG